MTDLLQWARGGLAGDAVKDEETVDVDEGASNAEDEERTGDVQQRDPSAGEDEGQR